jgi:hypothetical protein
MWDSGGECWGQEIIEEINIKRGVDPKCGINVKYGVNVGGDGDEDSIGLIIFWTQALGKRSGMSDRQRGLGGVIRGFNAVAMIMLFFARNSIRGLRWQWVK